MWALKVEKGKRGEEWIVERGGVGLDCKWDSTSRFARKINESATSVCLWKYKTFSNI